MRVTILTIGSRGDVQPYVALGMGLQAAGYDVRLATHVNFEELVRSRGLDFFLIAGDARETLEGEAGRGWLEAGGNPFAFMRRMVNAAKPVMLQILDDYWKACQDTDLILYPSMAALAVASITEKLDIPACPAYLQHVHPTSAYPSALARPLPRLGGPYNRLTYALLEQVFWQLMRPLTNRWRSQTLGLPPYSSRGRLGGWLKQRRPCLYGFSANVIPRPREWGDEVHVTGYWFLDRPTEWRPPAKLVDFLEAGSPPVFVGFGSMTNRRPEEVTDVVLKALDKSGQRGVILTGWGGLSDNGLSDDVFKIDSVPLDWLLPQTAVVVHHGGAGTTAVGLASGVPTVVVPFFGDQHFWAWRVEHLGAGPPPIPRRKLSAERLAAAIKEAIENKTIGDRASALGRRIRCEDGVGEAVSVLSRHFAVR